MEKKLFSIITVTLNSKLDLIETIKSLRTQEFKDFEYIVIDGGSVDGTKEVIKTNLDIIDKWVSEKDSGIYDAMNKGIKLADGIYIGMLNAGDRYSSNGLNIISNYLNNKDIDFIFGSVMKKTLRHGFKKFRIYWNFDFYSSHSSGFFIKNESQKKLGSYNLKYKISSDYDMFFRMIVKNKMKGTSTKKDEIVGLFKSGTSYSSTFSFYEHLIEETKIRLDNKQNKFFVFLIYCVHFFKNRKRVKEVKFLDVIKNFFTF